MLFISVDMGSEQSQHANFGGPNNAPRRINNGGNSNIIRLQRGNTIAVSSDHNISSPQEEAGCSARNSDSRPVSPPISVCSDSDLPYISYTDKPIGGKLVYVADGLIVVLVMFILNMFNPPISIYTLKFESYSRDQ